MPCGGNGMIQILYSCCLKYKYLSSFNSLLLVFFVNRVPQPQTILVPGIFTTLIFALGAQLTSTSWLGAWLSLLLFPLLLLRLGWLQLLVRRLKATSISILLTSLEVTSFYLFVNPLVHGCHPLCPPYFQSTVKNCLSC